MRIYTKAVWQWQPDGSLKEVPEECESFEYEGPLTYCGNDLQYMLNPAASDAQNQQGPIFGKGKMPPGKGKC